MPTPTSHLVSSKDIFPSKMTKFWYKKNNQTIPDTVDAFLTRQKKAAVT